ncbi:ATP-dependent RNA helicase HrpA [Parahalioglobus pacificus]|uniref:ATP-dependent helicase n=1 Tax=Parahalioglobus pacificus TaxID=930806 RepID=A0A918XDY5_9GAMM|nr:ATP-dependent RNA helicase HrpA [Halioglobus pacificus]GHD27404.1 ATP-dependent helicase [Halioglobus pacificus]
MSSTSAPLREIPDISFPPELPVSERREDIAALIKEHQVVILAGETGSGKTTQLPKLCLSLGRGLNARIGHTQPRRLAARAVAQRIAQELGCELGSVVGYQVRFNDEVSDATAIKLMTDGILLNEMQRDRDLKAYDTLIIDEAHERSLNIDFILGYLKRLLPRRPDLKVIITSATIDVESFSRHFDDAPIIEVSGRTFPVEVAYLGEPEDREEGVYAQVERTVDEIAAGRYGKRGDTLVFLPGERDIRELAKRLRHHEAIDVLPLYARLSAGEQARVFRGTGSSRMRVVLATNVAETSITVPGIRYVIDPGDARISRYSYRSRLQRLPIEPVSQASANQRKGRCGRVAEGVCLRLYSEDDFSSRPEFTDPEIHRTNLAAVILRMLELGLGDINRFPFVDPPDPRMVRDGFRLLQELGAVSARNKLTNLGRRMARLPIDPSLARMVLAAQGQGCLEEVLVVASALSIQDPRERPSDKQSQSDQFHARFKHPKSDFMALLNLWRYYEEQRQALSQNQLRKLCKREFLAYLRMREWRDVHTQLTIACRQQGIKAKRELPEKENYDGTHRALLAGLLGNIAQQDEGREFLGARNRKLQIFPGSSQYRKPPKWIVAAEIVETSKVFARVVAAIEPHWVLDVNPELLKHHYYEPRWQPRAGRVVAWERIALFGLTVSDRRSVHYGPIDPETSREVFIREALIAGRYKRPPVFLRANLALVKEVEDLESRTRRRDILVDENVLYAFYEERLPATLYTTRQLASWLKRHAAQAKALEIDRGLLMARDPGAELGQQFPDSLEWEGTNYALSYQFEPGGESDGVSVTIPIALLNRVPRFRFDWLVPGLLRDKCIQLVKALPKTQRKHLVPVPDMVDRALSALTPDNTDLLAALAEQFRRMAGVRLAPSDWQLDKLDSYYRMNHRIVDAQGKLLAQGRDLDALVGQFRDGQPEEVATRPDNSPARDGISQWDFDELPLQWQFSQAGVDIVSYPALVDKQENVSITLFDYADDALLAHQQGVARLAMLSQGQGVRYLRKQLLRGNDYNLALAGSQLDRSALIDDMIAAVCLHVLGTELPRSRQDFEQHMTELRAQLVPLVTEWEKTLFNTLQCLAQVRQLMAGLPKGQYGDSLDDVNVQISMLFAPGFITRAGHEWFSQYPRYVKALVNRLQRLSGQYDKDQKYTHELEALTLPLTELLLQRPGAMQLAEPVYRYAWMLQEFRVSLFAQNLGTRQAVSTKRLKAQWQAVTEWLAVNPR